MKDYYERTELENIKEIYLLSYFGSKLLYQRSKPDDSFISSEEPLDASTLDAIFMLADGTCGTIQMNQF